MQFISPYRPQVQLVFYHLLPFICKRAKARDGFICTAQLQSKNKHGGRVFTIPRCETICALCSTTYWHKRTRQSWTLWNKEQPLEAARRFHSNLRNATKSVYSEERMKSSRPSLSGRQRGIQSQLNKATACRTEARRLANTPTCCESTKWGKLKWKIGENERVEREK